MFPHVSSLVAHFPPSVFSGFGSTHVGLSDGVGAGGAGSVKHEKSAPTYEISS